MVAIVRELRHRISGNDLLVPVRHHFALHEKGNPRRPCLPQVNEKIANTALELIREKYRSARSAYDPRSLRSDARTELRPRCSSGMRIRRARWLVQKRRHVSHPMASSFATGTSHQLVCGGTSVASIHIPRHLPRVSLNDRKEIALINIRVSCRKLRCTNHSHFANVRHG